MLSRSYVPKGESQGISLADVMLCGADDKDIEFPKFKYEPRDMYSKYTWVYSIHSN